MKNIICIISGPTASGKTQTSINLAKKFSGEIVNFDSLLFYKEINVGTAKPTHDEMQNITHHMVSNHSIAHPINAADYIKEALPIVQDIHQRGNIVYLVGGSGFYLQALLYGMFESSTTPPLIREKSHKLYQDEGIMPFLRILAKHDPISFARYHENDHYRIRRAVEHYWTTHIPFSSSRGDMESKRKDGPVNRLNWNVFHIYLDLPKTKHLEIINERSHKMINSGLIEEVKGLLNVGFSGKEKPLRSIGYKETVDFIHGFLKTQEELIEKINISTRQLAKSQRTWFKKVEKNTYNPILDQEKIYNEYYDFLLNAQ